MFIDPTDTITSVTNAPQNYTHFHTILILLTVVLITHRGNGFKME
jgi:hypothetical protein